MQETYETWVPSLGWEDPLEVEMATHSIILAGESHGQRSLAGYSPSGHKGSGMTEETEDTCTHAPYRIIISKRRVCLVKYG